MSDAARPSAPKNLLILMVDQMRLPCAAYGEDYGLQADLKRLLSFQEIADDNPWKEAFPGFARLGEGAVVLSQHTIAATACIPSRASIMTGQYGARTGVTQTDGLFKSGDAVAFPWLEADGIPTIGHWFREAGYSTHYFGKCHFADPPEHTLEGLGFSDWELSWPEPHGSSTGNLGFYRDYQFADLACGFLRRKALGVEVGRSQAQAAIDSPVKGGGETETGPWCAVVSFTNPHDIAAYPALPRQVDPTADKFGPLKIPAQGTMSNTAPGGTWSFDLNPAGVGESIANGPPPAAAAPPENAPDCQWDYAIKLGLGLAAKTGYGAAAAIAAKKAQAGEPLTPEQIRRLAREVALASDIPFALSEDPEVSAERFLQYYGYLQSVVDQHINRVLQTLEETGLAEDTLVVFLPDHGEYGAIRGYNMEKWHAAWQEAVAVPVVFRHPSLNPGTAPIHKTQITSHVDLLPTLLGLMPLPDGTTIESIREQLRLRHPVPPFAGADLSGIVQGTSDQVLKDGQPREGVLFVTDDEISEPFAPDGDPHQLQSREQYAFFLELVDLLVEGDADAGIAPVPGLARGPIVQPNHVRTVRSGTYKLSRYFDPSGQVAPQWEMFNLAEDADPMELRNLLDAHGPFPKPAPCITSEDEQQAIIDQANRLGQLLEQLEAELLSPWPSAH